MKVAVIVLSVLALALAAPQPRKAFHDHVADFLDVIQEEAGADIDHLFSHYVEFEEFVNTLEYVITNNFKDLVYEMESLPEFVAVIEFLERNNIDIHFFIDIFNEQLEQLNKRTLSPRHTLSGTSFSAFITDSISEFPKAKLAALFEQKLAEDEDFRTAIESFESEEWDNLFSALWENEVFLKEVKTLDENGLNVHVLLNEIKAVFGQD